MVWLRGMSFERHDGAAHLSLTHIGRGDVEESFTTDDLFDGGLAGAAEAIIDVSRDGRVLGIEWLGEVPEVLRTDVQ